ncbi:MAG: M23 family metallopeptidase [Elusimicrobiota bacterium]|jgi:murein DD-endopeptidase MepM/ murein hydrolase activator NlpD|nr:M23 family metallopeptidase [Elusimicrobiota bacterium]
MMKTNKILRYIILIFVCAAIVGTALWIKISKLPIESMPEDDFNADRVVIGEGDLIFTTFPKTKLPQEVYNPIIAELRKHININKYKPGDFYEVYVDQNDEWFAFAYYPQSSEKDKFVLIKKEASTQNLTSSVHVLGYNLETYEKGGSIEGSSLWEAMINDGISGDTILKFADIFESQFDFLTETQKGDQYRIIYEQKVVNKTKAAESVIIRAASYKSSRKLLTAIYYESADGKRKGYYDLDGNSLKNMFLSAPLQYRRISSYFSRSRMHPILKYVRPHLGIDYAAPQGTPVSSVADGVVKAVGNNKASGNYVIITHQRGYETAYAHLSRFGDRIRRGAVVKQGQVIGYVGMTGYATGPHLDFRIRLNGTPLNFLTLRDRRINGVKLLPIDMPAFKELVAKYKNFLES